MQTAKSLFLSTAVGKLVNLVVRFSLVWWIDRHRGQIGVGRLMGGEKRELVGSVENSRCLTGKERKNVRQSEGDVELKRVWGS